MKKVRKFSYTSLLFSQIKRTNLGGGLGDSAVANVLDRDIIVSELVLPSQFYVLFRWERHETPNTPSSYRLNSNTCVFYKNGFGIK